MGVVPCFPAPKNIFILPSLRENMRNVFLRLRCSFYKAAGAYGGRGA